MPESIWIQLAEKGWPGVAAVSIWGIARLAKWFAAWWERRDSALLLVYQDEIKRLRSENDDLRASVDKLHNELRSETKENGKALLEYAREGRRIAAWLEAREREQDGGRSAAGL